MRAAGQSPRVAGAVEALALLHDDPGQRGERVGLLEHPLGVVRVQADPFPLAGAERAGLVPDRVGDAQPAELVHEPGAMQRPRPRRSPRLRWRPAAAASSATAVECPSMYGDFRSTNSAIARSASVDCRRRTAPR